MKRYLIPGLIALLLGSNACQGPENLQQKRPRLVVSIVVDQMRADYLNRYYAHFETGGFRRLMNRGYQYRNAYYPYMPTYTGPGHASVATGASPEVHGIISNNWYDKSQGKYVYCVSDTQSQSVGSATPAGQMSPHRLLVPTLADAMRLHWQMESKTIGISIKDRSAVFSAGHTGNGAYWLDNSTGHFITSSFYEEELPDWVKEFNTNGKVADYLSKPWDLADPIEHYISSGPDQSPYEGAPPGKDTPTFPYDLPALLTTNGFGLIGYTPFGNDILVDLAKTAITNEKLGQDDIPDMLAISFSATDKIGHRYGTQALELEDTYVRLDRSIAELLIFLDREIGPHNYVLTLTADHGGATVPAYLQELKVPAGYFRRDSLATTFRNALETRWGDPELLKSFSNEQIFLDHDRLQQLGLEKEEVIGLLSELAMGFPGVGYVLDQNQLQFGHLSNPILKRVQRGYHPLRSGDMAIVLLPGWMAYGPKGTSHGSPYPYDTQVPMIFYGAGILAGGTARAVDITQIAPTLSDLLGIAPPHGATGEPLIEVSP